MSSKSVTEKTHEVRKLLKKLKSSLKETNQIIKRKGLTTGMNVREDLANMEHREKVNHCLSLAYSLTGILYVDTKLKGQTASDTSLEREMGKVREYHRKVKYKLNRIKSNSSNSSKSDEEGKNITKIIDDRQMKLNQDASRRMINAHLQDQS